MEAEQIQVAIRTDVKRLMGSYEDIKGSYESMLQGQDRLDELYRNTLDSRERMDRALDELPDQVGT